jgi:hypothetical protein
MHSFAAVNAWSPDPSDFVIPNLLHPLWGKGLQRMFPSQAKLWVERSLYLGGVALVLATLAIWQRPGGRIVQIYALITLLSFALALGPILHWAGKEVVFSVPEVLKDLFVRSGLWPMLVGVFGTTGERSIVPLPAQLLRRFVPGFSSLRIWARFGLFTIFSVSVLAGMGLKGLLAYVGARRSLRVSGILYSVIVLLILFEFVAVPQLWPISQPALAEARPRAVDVWLSTQPQAALVEFPISLSGTQFYNSIFHGKNIVTGYGTFVPRYFQEKLPLFDTFPAEASLDVLREWQVGYVLVNRSRYGTDWPSISEHISEVRSLEFLREGEGILVYTLVP